VPSQANLRIDGDSARKEVSLFYNGRKLRAYEGETVGAALHAAGVKVLSRSIKYRRPRGLFCMAGNCPNCLMEVDGKPNVRACVYQVREGARVSSQSGWPSTRFDALAAIDRLGFLFPVGFPYRYFVRGGWLYHKWERLLRGMAGHGRPSNGQATARGIKTRDECEIAIVGAGPAGLTAAQAALSAGCRVALIDEGVRLGGSLLLETARYPEPKPSETEAGVELAQRLASTVEGKANVRLYSSATAFGYYDDGLLGIVQDNCFTKLRTKRLIVATGAYESPTIAENWDRPGVMLGTAAQRLLAQNIKPGQRAVVTVVSDFGLRVALQLLDGGVDVLAVADCRAPSSEPAAEMAMLRAGNIRTLTSHSLKAVRGRAWARAAVLAPSDHEGRIVPGRETIVSCDLIVTVGGLQPANELVFQGTYKGSYVLEAPGTLARVPCRGEDMSVGDDLYVAGNAGSIGDLEKSLLEGEVAGLSAAISLKTGSSVLTERCARAQAALAARRQL